MNKPISFSCYHCLGLLQNICNHLFFISTVGLQECAVSEYPESIHLVARALMMLQSLFGPIPTIRGKGPCVTALYNMMVELRREMAYNEPEVVLKKKTFFFLKQCFLFLKDFFFKIFFFFFQKFLLNEFILLLKVVSV